MNVMASKIKDKEKNERVGIIMNCVSLTEDV